MLLRGVRLAGRRDRSVVPRDRSRWWRGDAAAHQRWCVWALRQVRQPNS